MFKTFFIVILAIFFSDTVSSAAADTSTSDLKGLKDGVSKSAIRLYKAFASNRNDNIFVSPLSLQTVLVLAYTGAKGETASELAMLLDLPDKIEDTYSQYHELLKSIQSPVLHLANRMFVEENDTIKEDFKEKAEKFLFTSVESVDLQDSDNAEEHINEWAEENTNGTIKKLFENGVIDKYTRVVLANAVYFNADWLYRFPVENTTNTTFHLSRKDNTTVEMMHILENFWYDYSVDLKAKILGLKYSGDQFRMVVILPDDIEGLVEVESKLEKVIDILDKINDDPSNASTIDVDLPKFELENTFQVNYILESLGVKAMFYARDADFTGITDAHIAVTDIVQNTFVTVSEEGTEAAADTGVANSVLQSPPIEFSADHPFVFMITTVQQNIPILIGHFTGSN